MSLGCEESSGAHITLGTHLPRTPVNKGKKGKKGILCYVPVLIFFARAAAKSGMVPKVGTPETCSTFSGERSPLR
jgi:hypothetical protein